MCQAFANALASQRRAGTGGSEHPADALLKPPLSQLTDAMAANGRWLEVLGNDLANASTAGHRTRRAGIEDFGNKLALASKFE